MCESKRRRKTHSTHIISTRGGEGTKPNPAKLRPHVFNSSSCLCAVNENCWQRRRDSEAFSRLPLRSFVACLLRRPATNHSENQGRPITLGFCQKGIINLTWPCVCGSCGPSRPPRSRTRCGSCLSSELRLLSWLWTGPWSCWWCFLRQHKKEGGDVSRLHLRELEEQ